MSNGQDDRDDSDAAEQDVRFESFVMGLGTSALVHLGAVPHPETGQSAKDLAIARETIELLSLLEEKTRGNLSEREQKLLHTTLYDLRMRFVACCRPEGDG